MSVRRVCVLGPVPPFRGGIAHHTDELVRALRREAEVMVANYRRLYPRALFPGTSERDGDRGADASEALLIAWEPLTWARTAQRIRRFGAETVVAPYWHAAFAPAIAAVLGASGAKRRVLLAHNAQTHERSALDGVSWRLLRAAVDVVVVHAETDRAALSSRGFAHVVRVAHPAYDRFARNVSRAEARAELGLAPDDDVCLCFGLIRRYKGVDTAIAAIGRTRRARLLLVGEPYIPRREIDAAIDEARVRDRVTFVDRYVADDEVARYFAAADVLLAPYRHASHSGAVQIARATNLPVIASAVGGLPELVDALVPPDDVPALAAAIDAHFARPRETRPAAPGATWDELARAVLDG